MRAKPRILLDVDGPLGDFITPALDAIFKVTGLRFNAADHVKGWDIFTGFGLSDVDIHAVFESMHVPGFCLGIPAVDGSREGVADLREFAEVWAVTSPFGGSHWMHERDAWLVRNFGFDKKHVLHVRGESKHGVVGDMLVEDKIDTLVSWRAHHPRGVPVLFEYPYNRNHGWDGLSVSDWPNLVAFSRLNFHGWEVLDH